MSKISKELKAMENQQKALEQLNELTSTLNEVNKIISEFKNDARECLLNNDEAGFELIGNSIFYFEDIKKVIQTIKIQFQTYVKTAKVMGTIEGIRPILKQTAKMMNSYPSFNKNNKDFMKFRRGLMKGELNMKAMTSMMTSINPALSQSRSQEEFSDLKESLLVGTSNESIKVKEEETKEENLGNEDFFSMINE